MLRCRADDDDVRKSYRCTSHSPTHSSIPPTCITCIMRNSSTKCSTIIKAREAPEIESFCALCVQKRRHIIFRSHRKIVKVPASLLCSCFAKCHVHEHITSHSRRCVYNAQENNNHDAAIHAGRFLQPACTNYLLQ